MPPAALRQSVRTRKFTSLEAGILDPPDEERTDEQPALSKKRKNTGFKSVAKKKLKAELPETHQDIKPPLESLKPISDVIGPDLDILFCGINPGRRSSQIGHHFAGKGNNFWKALHQSGLTPRLLIAEEDETLPQFKIGLTNLVGRPSGAASELSTQEKRNGVPILLQKLALWKPRVCCFVGKDIWNTFERALHDDNHVIFKESTPEPKSGKRKKHARKIVSRDAGTVMPYKIIHNKTLQTKAVDSMTQIKLESEHDESKSNIILQEEILDSELIGHQAAKSPTSLDVKKEEYIAASSLKEEFNDSDATSGPSQTLFFMIYNTSGLAATKIERYVEWLLNLQEQMSSFENGTLDTSSYIQIRPPSAAPNK